MEEQLLTHVRSKRQSRENHFFSRKDCSTIAERLCKGTVQLASPLTCVCGMPAHLRRRGVAGVRLEPELEPKDYTNKVLRTFKVVTVPSGRILMRRAKRGEAQRWCPVVPVEDLPALFAAFHGGEGLGFNAAERLFVTVGA